nr:hypothetical protein [Tanacetum cinerariifolium]
PPPPPLLTTEPTTTTTRPPVMVIDDKSWTLLGHHEQEFYSGLEKFVNHCKPYIPLNNEHNEPTQRDIGETSNEPTQATRNKFEELYSSANEELYPVCVYVTRLDFMAKFTYFKVKGKLTNSIFNEMLEFFQNVFPISKGYKLPSSYYTIKKTFKMIGLGWKDSNTPGKKVPKKVLHYFSITHRLQRLYKSSHTAKEMIDLEL